MNRAEGENDDLASLEITGEEGRAVLIERAGGERRTGNVHEVFGSSRVVVWRDHTAGLWCQRRLIQ